MKSKRLIKYLSLMLVIPLLGLSSCGGKQENNNQPHKPNKPQVDLMDLTGFSTNITSASSVGIITKDATEKVNLANESKQVKDNTIILKKFGSNDGSNLKMTFNKVIPTNTAEEITITDEVVALNEQKNEEQTYDASITFMITKGFTYSLYEEADSTSPIIGYEDIKDGSNLDKNGDLDFVTLDNLLNNHIYYLKYTGRGEYINKSQEDLNVEIDKLYTTSGFTFVSFVPKGESKRPLTNIKYDLIDDELNILDYDKTDYFSNTYNRKSYVIDNRTGLLYYIDQFKIIGFEHGLLDIELDKITSETNKEELRLNKQLYDYKVNSDNEFVLLQLYQNKDMHPNFAFKDKYGNIFINNETLNKYEEDTKTTFFTTPFNKDGVYTYSLTDNNETIRTKVRVKDNKSRLDEVKILNSDGDFVDLPKDKDFRIMLTTLTHGYVQVYKYVNNEIYYSNCLNKFPNDTVSNPFQIGKKNLITNKVTSFDASYLYNDITKKPNDLLPKFLLPFLRDDIIVVFYEYKLYYVKNIFDDIEKFNNNPSKKDECFKWNLFLENINIYQYLSDVQIKKLTVNGNIIYNLFLEDGAIVAYEHGQYAKPLKVTLQPLNK